MEIHAQTKRRGGLTPTPLYYFSQTKHAALKGRTSTGLQVKDCSSGSAHAATFFCRLPCACLPSPGSAALCFAQWAREQPI
jgi:hypothetical protein